MRSSAFENGTKVKVSETSEIKSLRGVEGVVVGGLNYLGSIYVDFGKEYETPLGVYRMVDISDLERVE